MHQHVDVAKEIVKIVQEYHSDCMVNIKYRAALVVGFLVSITVTYTGLMYMGMSLLTELKFSNHAQSVTTLPN